MKTEPEKGGCLCGDIRYEFDRKLVISAHHCHCLDCQRCTGSGKATIIFLPRQALRLTGELKVFSVVGTDGGHVNRAFCPNCGSPTISYVDENPDLTFVKAGTLDESSWVTVASSYWSTSAKDWSPLDYEIPHFVGNPEWGTN